MRTWNNVNLWSLSSQIVVRGPHRAPLGSQSSPDFVITIIIISERLISRATFGQFRTKAVMNNLFFCVWHQHGRSLLHRQFVLRSALTLKAIALRYKDTHVTAKRVESDQND